MTPTAPSVTSSPAPPVDGPHSPNFRSKSGSSSSSLDPLETSPHAPTEFNHFQRQVHRRTIAARHRIIRALEVQDEPTLLKRANRIRLCCRWPFLIETDDGRLGISAMRCRDRACPTCAYRRSRKVRECMFNVIEKMDSPRFLTLTIAHSDAPLQDCIRHLRESFANLRRTAAWKYHVTGGLYVIEIKRNERTKQWHPHLHAVIDGEYFRQSALVDAWKSVTGDSCIVDIRALHSRREAAKYISKYVTKPNDVGHWPEDCIIEWIEATHGMRTCSTFGKYHNVTADARDPNEVKHEALRLISLAHFNLAIERGIDGAIETLRILHATQPALAGMLPQCPNEPPFDIPPPSPEEAATLPRRLQALATAVAEADHQNASHEADVDHSRQMHLRETQA